MAKPKGRRVRRWIKLQRKAPKALGRVRPQRRFEVPVIQRDLSAQSRKIMVLVLRR